MGVLPGIGGLIVPSLKKPPPAFVHSAQANSNSFSSVSFGTVHAKRVIVVTVGTLNNRTASACSIGGGSATLVRTVSDGSNMGIQMFYRALATGTSGTVSFTKTADETYIAVYAIYPDTAAPNAHGEDTGTSSPASVSLAALSGGVLLFGLQVRNSDPMTGGWSGAGTVVEDVDALNGTRSFGAWHVFGTPSATRIASATHTSATSSAFIAATWGA